jgi:GTP-binding protein
LTRIIDDKVHEPYERVTIDVPEDYLGAITQLLSVRKGRMEQLVPQGSGWIRMDWRVPARGLIGFRTEFMTDTRGTGVLHHVLDGWEPWAGEIRTRPSGSIVADRTGVATGYAIEQIQERATLFVAPGTDVYEGMIIGENSRGEDMDVNVCREKKVTNIRASSADEFVKLVPPRVMTLEQALEFISDDECVEVTPEAVRLRKVSLDATSRARQRKQLKGANSARA